MVDLSIAMLVHQWVYGVSPSYPHHILMISPWYPHFPLNSTQKFTACNAQPPRLNASAVGQHTKELSGFDTSRYQCVIGRPWRGREVSKPSTQLGRILANNNFIATRSCFVCWVLEVFGLKMIQNAQFRTTIDAQQDQKFKLRQRW